MGWDYTNIPCQGCKPTSKEIKNHVDKKFTWESDTRKVSVVKSIMVGSIYYGAVKDVQDGKETITAVVVLTNNKDREFNFGCKVIGEESGPNHYSCPESILSLLSPAPNEWANEWREKCRKRIKDRKLFKDAPVGTVFELDTNIFGREMKVRKEAPAYQFKRPWYSVIGASNAFIKESLVKETWINIIPV